MILCAFGLESFEPQTVVRGDVKSEVFRRPRPNVLVKGIKPMLNVEVGIIERHEIGASSLMTEGLRGGSGLASDPLLRSLCAYVNAPVR